jgi:hypothetical protein
MLSPEVLTSGDFFCCPNLYYLWGLKKKDEGTGGLRDLEYAALDVCKIQSMLGGKRKW